jgi:gliding motility-associated-like protein
MRIFLTLLLAGLLINIISFAQSPGGIAGGNTIWLRADNGVTSSASVVSQWQEQSGANITGNFTVQPLNGTVNTQTGPTLIGAGINFNPYLRFDGNSNSLSSINLFPGTSIVGNSNLTVFQVFNLKGGIVWLKWETDQVGSIARLGFENAGGNIRFDYPKAVPATAGQNVGVTNVLNKHSLSTAYADATQSVNRLNGANNNTIAIPGPGDFSAATDKIVIGNENLINLPAQIDMAELAIYAVTLSASERNKIESYLAIKYGFTLDQAAVNGNDYTSSNGSVTWNRAANSGYANDITGIGRDDATALLQKQSKSINATSLVTLYNGAYAAGNFPILNSDNSNGFTIDASFLLIGDNGLPATAGPCFYNGKAQRMQRIWKASRLGTVGTVTIAIDQAAVPVTIRNIIVSDDPTFPAATTAIYPLATANGKLFASLTLNQNDYFSFVTDTITVTLTPTQPICSNPNSGSVSTTVTGGIGTYGYTWAPGGQVTSGISNVPGGAYAVTITQGACQASYPITLSAPGAPAAPSVNAVSICSGNTATLDILAPNAAYTYNWFSTASGGTALATGTSYTTPALTGNTTYYAEATNGTCVSTRTAVTVTITTVADPVVNSVTICSGATATLTVQNPVAGQTYNWFTTATGGTATGTGTSFTSPPLTSPTTYYAEASIGTCINTRVPVSVSLNIVVPPAATGDVVCPGNGGALAVLNPDQSLYTYTWYDAATGGTSIGSGIAITSPALTSTTTFYVAASDGTCSSIRTPVTVSLVPPLLTPVITSGNISQTSITFNWQPVPGASGYQVSVDGSPFSFPSSGPTGTTHILNNLQHSQTVTINVVALNTPGGCGNSNPGQAQATTFGDGFYMPGAFSPNGVNTTIKPMLPGGAQMVYFMIFNRWGQRVFSTRTNAEAWDGKWQGKEQPNGTYVWMCKYVFINGRIIDEKGTFLLLR